MRFLELLKMELIKGKRGKIVPFLFMAPMIVVLSGVANLHSYFTPEYTNAWAAMFIQSALVYAYYFLPFSMIIVSVMLAEREKRNNGILKMLTLPVSRHALFAAKFCILLLFLLLEIGIFFVVFVIAGIIAVGTAGITETLPLLYLFKWCAGLFLTMLPSVTVMWTITVRFGKPLLAVGFNLFLVIPGVLVANTPFWIVYPYCYSGYLVSCFLHTFTTTGNRTGFALFPFFPCALFIFVLFFAVSLRGFGSQD